MSDWENMGKTDDWYTPAFVFEALGEKFDLDVAAPVEGPRHVPMVSWISEGSLDVPWRGFIWMNPPFGGRNGLVPWLDKFFDHGHGLALTPDRTSAPWWQDAHTRSDAFLVTRGKIKFERPDGSIGKSPGSGVTIWAAGARAAAALRRCTDLGAVSVKVLP
tara:strand:- start:9489 stop:9971 length:483 start_codon:yes stop_codon:yes gene_type:complete